MKNYRLFVLLFLSAIYGYSQPSISWQKSLGGSGDEYVTSIQKTTDGGYVVAGYSRLSSDGDVTGNHGSYDYWIVKLSNAGIIEWQKSLGGTQYDAATSIKQTTDGGYIIAGQSTSNDGDVTGNHGNNDCWIVKVTNKGILEWQKSLGGKEHDYADSIQQTSEGGYVIAGRSLSKDGDITGNHGDYDSWIVKLTSTGVIEWQKSLGGSGSDNASSIQQTTDGGYIIAGYSSSNDGDVTGNHGSSDYWIIKLTNLGIIEWQKTLGGTDLDYASSIQRTTDGGYIIAGYSQSNNGDVTGNHGSADCWVVKLSNVGIIEWQKSLGGTDFEVANSIQLTTDGGYIIAGFSTSHDGDLTENHGDHDFWIVKLIDAGTIEWQKSFGGTGTDQAISILQTTDGGYIIAGISTSDNGDVAGHHSGSDYWIIKLNIVLSTDESTFGNLFSVYPNPANKEIHIDTMEAILGLPYTIYDQLGRSVMAGKLNEHNSIIGTDNLAKGVYILSVGDKIRTNRKIIKE